MFARITTILIMAGLLLGSGLSAQNLIDGAEHATYDIANDRYIVCSYNTGAIIAVDGEGNQESLITGLGHAYGNHILGDTLYVTAGRYIYAYDLNSLALHWIQYVTISHQMDGIATDTSGYLYVVDYDMSGVGKIIRIRISDHTYEDFITAGLPNHPQDLIFDAPYNRLILASYAANAPVLEIDPTDASLTTLVTTPFGFMDGIAMDNDRNIYLTCYTAGEVYRYDSIFTDPPVLLSNWHNGPSGLGYNPIDNILAVPNFGGDRLDLIPLDDNDNDSTLDFIDNCPGIYNPDQLDSDGDEIGDVCDGCPNTHNPDQEDGDGDGVQDACDNCPETYNQEQYDSNSNGVGDACDWKCGDATGNDLVNILDVTYIISFLYKSGPAPDPTDAADVNSSGEINILDVTYLISFLYKNGADPNCP